MSIVFMLKSPNHAFGFSLYMFNMFKLPPVSERRTIGGIIKKFNYPDFTKEADGPLIFIILL